MSVIPKKYLSSIGLAAVLLAVPACAQSGHDRLPATVDGPVQADTAREFCTTLGSGRYAGVKNIPDVLVMRACAWMHAGLVDQTNEDDFRTAAAGGNGQPGSPAWVAAYSEAGDKWMALGEQAEANNNGDEAFQAFESAQHFYYLARWPHIFSPEAGTAYQKHVHAYRKMAHYFDPPLEEVAFEFQGQTTIGHLRIPEGDGPHPLIVLSPGIDDWKGEVNDFIFPMLEAGFATYVIDLQGTGESTLKLAAGSHEVFSAAIDHVKTRPDIDESKIGFYGLSGGGYNAVAMALTDDDIKASVNVGGPVHYSFQEDWLNVTPQSIYMTITTTAGFNEREIGRSAVMDGMAPISLQAQGLITPRENAPALLTINGEKDILAHPGEYRFLDDAGIEQDMLIFENDGHVAPAHFDIHIPFSITWLQKKLRVSEPQH